METPPDKPVELVWNKGIARLCDWRLPDEFPDGLTYRPVQAHDAALDNFVKQPTRFGAVRDGDLVWVRATWLPFFVRRVLPLIQARFVLVTGDSDTSIPAELADEAATILACPHLIRWYAQNYDGGDCSGKLAPLPIGIDFHTLAERPAWGEEVTEPRRQADFITALYRHRPDFRDRIPKVYVDFGWQVRPPGRALAGAALDDTRQAIAHRLRGREGVFVQNAPLPRTMVWRSQSRFAAVLSPHGVGLDCHRSWEALALGHLVVAPTSSLDPLFEGLPVVLVDSWDEITQENLERWLAAATPSPRLPAKLTSAYWIEQMRSAALRF